MHHQEAFSCHVLETKDNRKLSDLNVTNRTFGPNSSSKFCLISPNTCYGLPTRWDARDEYKRFRKRSICHARLGYGLRSPRTREEEKKYGEIYIYGLSCAPRVSFFHHSCGRGSWKEDNTMMEIGWGRWRREVARGGEWFATTARSPYRVCRMSCGHKQPHTAVQPQPALWHTATDPNHILTADNTDGVRSTDRM